MTFDGMEKQSGAVPFNEGLPIRYDLYYPREAAKNPLPVILFLHGFKGFKDWGTFPAVCKSISEQGFAVIAMNFSLNGIGDNPMEFDRLDLFARETFSQDLDDVGRVIKAIPTGDIAAEGASLDVENIGILGHSRGGHTAVAAAAEYSAIKCLVTWSAVADYNARWSDAMKNDWEQKGVTEIKNGRTGQIMPLKKVIYDDIQANANRLIALKRIKECTMPSLLIHSNTDEAVSVDNAQQLYAASPATEKELLIIPESGHTFGGSHPFDVHADAFPPPLELALSATKDWFGSHLK